MELKEFVKNVITDLDSAVSEANNNTDRTVRFRGVSGERTSLEFDVAVTVESSKSGKTTGGGIKVWGIGEIGAGENTDYKNSTVSRIKFGVDIALRTKKEIERQHAATQTVIKRCPGI